MVSGRLISMAYGPGSASYERYYFVSIAGGENHSILKMGTNGGTPGSYIPENRVGALSQAEMTTLTSWYGAGYTFPTLMYIHYQQQLGYIDQGYLYWLSPIPELIKTWEFEVKGRLIYDTRPPTPSTAWSTNPAMCLRHFIGSVTYGGNVSAADLDEQSFMDAADACDVLVNGKKRFELNLVVLSEGTARQWIDTICTHFAAQIYVQDGKWKLWVDQVTADSGILFDSTNSREWQLTATPISERPSRVIVEYPRATNKYAPDKAIAELPEASTAGQTREATYKLDGVTDPDQAQRLADYMLKVQALSVLRVAFLAAPVAIKLTRGTRFKLTFPNGCTAQDFLVTDLEPQPNGEIRVSARQYDANVYTPAANVSVPTTPTPPPSEWDAPPDITIASSDYHEVVTTTTPSQVIKTRYVSIVYSLPDNYMYCDALVIRGKNTGGPYLSDIAWTSLENEIVLPLTGNLPPITGTSLQLYYPFEVGYHSWNYYPSLAEGAINQSLLPHHVTVRLRNTRGILSPGVNVRLPYGISSVDSGSPDPGTALETTQELRLVEDPSNGTNYWKVKPATSLSANRTLTLPDTSPDVGPIVVDTGGNVDFRKDFSFSAHKNGTNQTGVVTGTPTKVTFGTEEASTFDYGSGYDASNSKFLPGVAGRYMIMAAITMFPDATATMVKISVYVNGSAARAAALNSADTGHGLTAHISCVLDLGASDYVEIYATHSKTGNGTIEGAASITYFSGFRVG